MKSGNCVRQEKGITLHAENANILRKSMLNSLYRLMYKLIKEHYVWTLLFSIIQLRQSEKVIW